MSNGDKCVCGDKETWHKKCYAEQAEASSLSDLLYRKLELGEKIQAGDQWLNHDWEVGGPWYTVEEKSKNIGVTYEAHFREMRRTV